MDFEVLAGLIAFAALVIIWAMAPDGVEAPAQAASRVPAAG